MSSIIKKVFLVTILLIFAFKGFAPSSGSLVIFTSQPAEPFRKLISAIGMVETKFDTLAYNTEEEAVGYFQIRPIRLQDYNERTGSNYIPADMYNYKISEKVFLYYASALGPYNFEKIAKNWNGSGKKTIQYWKKVKNYL
jgi:hypothetical protein